MKRQNCSDCGTVLEKGGICQNCDEAAYILEYQGEYVENPSEKFLTEAEQGYIRAKKRREAFK